MGTIDKKLIYRKRKGIDDVKKYTKTVNPDLPGQATQKGYFKEAIEAWKINGYSQEDKQAWNLYARNLKKAKSGFNMFASFRINAVKEGLSWDKLTGCNVYDITGVGFKVDINVDNDYSGKLYYGTSKLYMANEVPGVFSVDKYTFTVTGLSMLTNYYFYIENKAVGKGGRTGIYSKKTSEYTPIIIDIGSPAILRVSNAFSGGRTRVLKDNPANETGVINKLAFYVGSPMSGVEVATFFIVSGSYLSTRDTEYIGDIASGYQEKVVNINVNIGDYIGFRWVGGSIKTDFLSGVGHFYRDGDFIPCTNDFFFTHASQTFSIYGTGLV